MSAKIGTVRMERDRAIQGQKDMRRTNRSIWYQLQAAHALLSDALETFDDNPREDHEVADRIRTFLKGIPQ